MTRYVVKLPVALFGVNAMTTEISWRDHDGAINVRPSPLMFIGKGMLKAARNGQLVRLDKEYAIGQIKSYLIDLIGQYTEDEFLAICQQVYQSVYGNKPKPIEEKAKPVK